mgnify:CR=1 FL=1
MRYFISSNEDALSVNIKRKIHDVLSNHEGFTLDGKNPELIISIGGDGRFLKTINHYVLNSNSFAIVGISTGKLGFLCDYQAENIDLFLEDIINHTPRYDQRKLIEVTFKNKEYLFLNEFRLEKIFDTLNCQVYLNEHLFLEFKGNGLNFSTSTGSTAYNRSLNGPIINPHYNIIIMNEIAPLNNSLFSSLNSPLILTDKDLVSLKGNFDNVVFGGDTFHQVLNCEREEISIKLSDKKITFAHFREYSFYDKVKKSFLDRR